MNIVEKTSDGITYNIIDDKEIVIDDESSALDLIGNLYYSNNKNIVIPISAISDDFWDLKNTIAGNVFQKFVLYGIKVAILGDLENAGKSLKAFIVESNRGENLFFVNSVEDAIAKFK